MRVRIIGIGMGPQHLTREAAAAIADCDYIVAAQKRPDDELLAIRQDIAASFGVALVVVPDPERNRADPVDYPGAVQDWHEARVAAYAGVLAQRGGTAGFLVWGDPSLYDSTLRVIEQVGATLPLTYDVIAGVSAPQLLAARHRIVLHPVGQPLHITTARRLREAIDAGQSNLCVFLVTQLDLLGLEEWTIWWGANLGATGEELVTGRVGDVLDDVQAARQRAKRAAGWVMDLFLLRAPEASS